MNPYYIKLLVFLLLLFVPLHSQSQSQIQIMSYNLLNYPGADSAIRNPYFRTVLQATEPDILVVQEMESAIGISQFLNMALNHNSVQYAAGDFIDTPLTDNALFYKPGKITFVSNTPINTTLRDINEFKIIFNPTGDTLRIFTVHLKAGSNSLDSLQRASEVDSLRKATNVLPAGTHFVVCGDFNIRGANELAFQKLLDSSNPGYAMDPLNLAGNWHNNFSLAPFHTQSTRLRDFGGGATGGLDDRFDMILISQSVSDTAGITYLDNSYLTFGNDGMHFNDSINGLPNQAVSDSIANALHYASDHLPVMASFGYDVAPDTRRHKILISEIVVTPTAAEFIEIYNPNLDTVDLSNYYLTDATFAPNGTYYYNIVTGANYGGGDFADFHARFPAGALIQPGQYQTVALAGDSAYYSQYGVIPTYELYEDGHANPQDAPNMREAVPGSINNQGGLTNSDEVVVLYYWDGFSDLVEDVDYLIYDDAGAPPTEAVDKTGIVIDGPDTDLIGSAYLNDSPIPNQLPAPAPGIGFSTHRIDYSEGAQTSTGGNGVSGADETSEDLNNTFIVALRLSLVKANVNCPTDAAQNCPTTAALTVDMTNMPPPDNLLGSLTVCITWDPALLDFVAHSGLLSGFTGTVDTSNVSNGELCLNGSNPSGVGGIVDIISVDFEVIGSIGAFGTVDVSFSAINAAITFADLLPFITLSGCSFTIIETCLLGDINGDGVCNSTDCLLALSYDAGIPIPQPFVDRINNGCGDVNGDGITNSTDCLILLSNDAGIPVPFPVCQLLCSPPAGK